MASKSIIDLYRACRDYQRRCMCYFERSFRALCNQSDDTTTQRQQQRWERANSAQCSDVRPLKQTEATSSSEVIPVDLDYSAVLLSYKGVVRRLGLLKRVMDDATNMEARSTPAFSTTSRDGRIVLTFF